jgi:light-regulated signal transduction histidine kinase (bacteriophytochrome)
MTHIYPAAERLCPEVDLSTCDREPIHQLGGIQPFGFLIVFSADWRALRVSANVAAYVGREPGELLGRPVHDIFAREAIHSLRNRLVQLHDHDAVERVFGVALLANDPARLFDCAVHHRGATVVVEAEPSASMDPSSTGTLIRSMISRLEGAADMPAFLRLGARQVHALTGFDRVMVYRFGHDGAGEVAAEVVRGDGDSYLGLRYPASDIPRQARELYVRTPFRIIADVEAAPVPVVPVRDETGEPLDLSLSVLRAVSGIHVQYLKNMGVAASLSISIVVDGKLWGLFACHHPTPRRPSFAERTIAELFGQLFALRLEARERQAAEMFETAARAVGDRMLATIAGDAGLLDNPEWIARTIGAILPCDGVGIWLDGRIARSGRAPPAVALPAIIRELDRMAGGTVFATDHLAGHVPDAADYVGDAAGMLAIPISRQPRDYVLLFRQEKLRSVVWAGDPRKPVQAGPGGGSLTPRASFAAWREEVRGRSDPFTDNERRVADTLRTALIEIVLKLTETAEGDRLRATQRQELLIAELNHRVRNILALIRGLVSRSRRPDMPLADYVATLDGRIEALARAHDQITEDKWSAARLRMLFETEASIYSGDVGESVIVVGEEVMLEPTAFSTMALVVHELMTNSIKYGALGAGGRVLVDWIVTPDGGMTIEWRERGGPVVELPTRQGFGTTIIRRSVPYDLGGSAEVFFDPQGLEVRLMLPAAHVRRLPREQPTGEAIMVRPAVTESADLSSLLVDRSVILVEDSLIIALDAEDLLTRLGAARVAIAASVGSAMEELARARPDLAVLDVNLGEDTSFPVADYLRSLDVPFIFATGYGNQLDVPHAHRGVTILQKPYTLAGLRGALAELIDQSA